MSDQVGGNAFWVCLKLVDELGVPEVVQASGFEPGGRDPLVVSAPVIVVGAVQWLVEVADEVEQELGGDDLLFVVSGGILPAPLRPARSYLRRSHRQDRPTPRGLTAAKGD